MSAHFSHQPNVPGKGIIASYSRTFWGLVVVLGVATGLGAAVLTLLLNVVEHASWAYSFGDFLTAIEDTSALRPSQRASEISPAPEPRTRLISSPPSPGGGRLSFWKSPARGVLSIVIVGMGASLGREAAPQLTGAAVATALSDWAKLPGWQRRLLVASGAGAGMAAVYNVPRGGALFAVEVLLGTLSLPVVIPAVATSAVATFVAWIVLPTHATYQVPTFHVSASEVAWAVIIGPIAGVLSVGWIKAIMHVNGLKPKDGNQERERGGPQPLVTTLALRTTELH